MFIQRFEPHELHFAYCYRVYFRWRTHRSRLCPTLRLINSEILDGLVRSYGIRVLKCAADEADLLAIVSLQPSETISACASKMKGRVSKWLGETLRLTESTHLLSRGYFAYTIGKSRRKVVERYLEKQSEHHGYYNRLLPPVFSEKYEFSAEDKARISAKHAEVSAQLHLVLATQQRRGVFASQDGRNIATAWRRQQAEMNISIVKVSFVPDHVHIALRMHPTCSPTEIVVALMNTAQDTVQETLIRAGLERLWATSAYLGSYGDLASSQIGKYIENFRAG